MTEKEQNSIRTFIESKALLLLKSEKRSFAKVNFDIGAYNFKFLNGRRFVIISCPVFYQIIDSILSEACEKYPEKFGKGDVYEVLEAVYLVEAFGSLDQFSDFLKEEQFAWILELIDGEVNQNVLRIELFRKVNVLKNDKTKTEFTGGLFHTFKHFNYKNIPLSTKQENNNIAHPRSIIDLIIFGFFFSDIQFRTANECNSDFQFDTGDKYKYAFFLNKDANVFFVNSIYRI